MGSTTCGKGGHMASSAVVLCRPFAVRRGVPERHSALVVVGWRKRPLASLRLLGQPNRSLASGASSRNGECVGVSSTRNLTGRRPER